MRAWLVPAAVLLGLSPAAPAQTCNLVDVVQPGDCFRYGVEMKLTGEMRFQRDAGPVPVKLTASASHAYPERVLDASGGLVRKAARVYEAARLTVERGADRTTTTLRPARKLIVAQRPKDQQMAYSPTGISKPARVSILRMTPR